MGDRRVKFLGGLYVPQKLGVGEKKVIKALETEIRKNVYLYVNYLHVLFCVQRLTTYPPSHIEKGKIYKETHVHLLPPLLSHIPGIEIRKKKQPSPPSVLPLP